MSDSHRHNVLEGKMFGGTSIVIYFGEMCVVCEQGQDIQGAPEAWLQESGL